MKKILTTIFFLSIFSLNAMALETNNSNIGVAIFKEPYNKKTIIYSTLPKSPASIIPIGSEIIKINDKRTRPMNIEEITSLLQGKENSTITIETKDLKNKKHIYTLVRKKLIQPQNKINKRFDVHWQQVAPEGYANINIDPLAIRKKLSSSYMKSQGNAMVYWRQRKNSFKKGYDACLYYPQNEQNSCLMNLVNREISRTAEDKNLEIQKEILKTQKSIESELYYTNTNMHYQNYQLRRINNNIR